MNRSLHPRIVAQLCCGSIIATLGATTASAQDSFNPLTSQLSIPTLTIGNAVYSNVVVTPAQVLGISGGNAGGSADRYDPATGILSIPSVLVNGVTYTNVSITVKKLVSIASASGIDTYNPATSQLRIPYVKVGNATYYDVVVNATPAAVAKVAGGLPSATQDVYSGTLQVPAVQVGAKIYTNVTLSVGVGSIASLGAASAFEDAPVQGLCYGTTPSATATASPTIAGGLFLYDPGDSVTFWIDGSGKGCTGTTSSSASSVLLGTLKPTGKVTSILALAGGAQAADTLAALNVGSATQWNVSGLQLNPSDVSTLNAYIRTQGYNILNNAPGSIDAFFSQVQADTTTAGNSLPGFVTPVQYSTATLTSALEQTVASGLVSAAAAVPGQPGSLTIPASGELLFNVGYTPYTCPQCSLPSTVYDVAYAELTYLDGHGNVSQFGNPELLQNTPPPLSEIGFSGTYAVSGNVLTLTETGQSIYSGDPTAYTERRTVNYADATTQISTLSYTTTDTSVANPGVLTTGTGETSGIRLTPLTPSMLVGISITQPNAQGCPNSENILSFTGNASSVTLTASCGGNPVTLVPSSMPGILFGTDSTGYEILAGLYGPSVSTGSYLVVIQLSLGSLGLNGNGNPNQWQLNGPLIVN
jgi:hypothetical protein